MSTPTELAVIDRGAVAMKVCTRCGESKPRAEFPPNGHCLDGRLGQCRVCKRASERERYASDPEPARAYQRAYQQGHRPLLREYFREYRRRHPEIIRAGQQRWNDKSPEKRRAHSALWNALRSGVVIKGEACAHCGATDYVEAHHPDYAQPLHVQWLCELCHVKADQLRRSMEV